MIEAIPTPFDLMYTNILLALFAGGVITLVVGISLEHYKIILSGLGVVLTVMMLMGVGISDSNDYREQINDQLLTLECEEYEEAYELYKKEFIKTEYQKRCVENLEWWK